MAVFGLPGGAEWLVIGITILLLFVPGLGFGLLGYMLGRRSARSGPENGGSAGAPGLEPGGPEPTATTDSGDADE